MNKHPHNVNLSRKRIANLSLSQTEKSVILGGILGDGSLKLYPPYKNARYSFRHSEKQYAYFSAKCKLLTGISNEKHQFPQEPDGWSTEKKWRYCSAALESLTQLYTITHRKNKKVVLRKWLNHCTARSLAIWWFDDGSLVANRKQGCISTDSFSEKECGILARYLWVVWKIRARVHPVRRGVKKLKKGVNSGEIVNIICTQPDTTPELDNEGRGRGKSIEKTPKIYYRLYLSTEPLKKLLDIILPHLPCPEIIYKCCIRYAGVEFQQRWISHLLANCPPEMRDDCERIIQANISLAMQPIDSSENLPPEGSDGREE